MDLFLAIDTETGEVKAFVYKEDLKKFADEHEYAYDYFEVNGVTYPIGFSELRNQ